MTETYKENEDRHAASTQESAPGRVQDAGGQAAPARGGAGEAGSRPPQGADEGAGIHDPLVDCLVEIAGRLSRRISPQAVIAGLPMAGGRLAMDHFDQAAERAGLVAETVKIRLRRIREAELPVIALLRNGGACILEGISAGGETVTIRVPPSADPQAADASLREVSRKAFEQQYGGRIIRLRPQSAAREVAEESGEGRAWFWQAFRPSAGIYGQVFAMTMIINLFSLAIPLFIMNVYDRVVPNAALHTLWALAIGVFIAAGLDFILRTLRTYVIDVAGRRADIHLATNLYSRLIGARLEVRGRSSGAQANVVREYETLRDFFNSATLATFGDLIFIALFILVIWMVAGRLALIPAITVPIVVCIALLTQVPLRNIAKRSFREASQKNAVLFETLGGIETLKAVGGEGWARDRWERSVAETIRTGMRSRFFSSININAVSTAQIVSTVLIVVLGVYDIQAGDLTTGALIAAVILNGRVIAPLGQVASVLARMYQAIVAFTAVNAIMKAPQESGQRGRFVEMPDLKGGIEFTDVEFAYPGEHQNVLRSVNLQIEPGERVGIVGPIGSGKSTILKLVLGLYLPRHGMILLDGVDLSELDPGVVRANVGYVPQGGALFRGSVRENITIHAPYVDDAALLKAVELSGVADWLRNAPKGLDTPVGEQGRELSGGQRQSVALARALLLRPRILLLDEPTTGLDRRAELLLSERLRSAAEGRTVIVVSHSQAALSLVDRLIVVEGGRITVSGPKQEVTNFLSDRHARVRGQNAGAAHAEKENPGT